MRGLSEPQEGHRDPQGDRGLAGAAWSPQYSREGQGAPWRRGIRVVLEVPVCEDDDTEPPTVPQAGANSHGPLMSPCTFIPQHSPAPLLLRPAQPARVPLGDPWWGEERRCRGVSYSPSWAVPTWQQELGTAPVTSSSLLGPGLGSLHPCRHRGQCPGMVGTLKPWCCDLGAMEGSALGELQPSAPAWCPPSSSQGDTGTVWSAMGTSLWGGLVG